MSIFFRKTSVKRLQNQESKSKSKPKKLDTSNELSLKATLGDRKIIEPYQSTFKYEIPTSSNPQKSNNKEELINNGCRPILKRPTNTRLEERYKELFGDDDIGVVKNKAPKLVSSHTIISDNKVTNVLSTTVNVNIYNSSETEDYNRQVNRKTHSENSTESSNETCNNRLRIDVSLSKNGSNFVEARSLSKNKRKPKTNVGSYKSRKKQRVHNQSKSQQLAEKNKLDQIKSDMLVLSALHNDNSEDDPVQELWKIFGMESPTDRSENIIKSYPQTLNLKDITNNENSMLNVLPQKEQANEVLTKPTAVSTLDSISSEELPTNKKGCENIENTSADRGKNTSGSFDKGKVSKNFEIKSVDRGNNVNESVVKEPLCKIAETFSLAELSPGSLFYDGLKPSKECHETRGKSANLSIRREAQRIKNNQSGLCSVETISLCDDEDDEDLVILPSEKNNNDTVIKKLNENQTKVGTIRVKNLGQLMDPQNVPETSRTALNNNIPLQCNEPKNGDQENTDTRAVQQFYDTYKFYFDELLESKILKLGELLHLAVSDEIRRKERIKRAEQLSSSDLIQDEIQRANKDFTDLMNVRGSEFAPLFENILGKFDGGSKVTLFMTLFIRIFDRAKEIDIENGNHMLPAKKVIHTMLLKTLSMHEDVLCAMNYNSDEFIKQLNLINKLLKAYHTMYSSQNSDAAGRNVVSNNVLTNYSTITNNMPQETTNSNSAFNTNNVFSEVDNISTHPSIVGATAPSVQSANSVNHVTFQSNSNHKIAHNETKIAGPTNVSTVTVQPQKTANKSVIPQTVNSASTDTSIIKSPSYRPNTTPTPPTINANRNNSMSQSTSFTSIAHNNSSYSSFQTTDSERNMLNSEPTHSVVKRLGTKLNYINQQQNELYRQMANSGNPAIVGLAQTVLMVTSNQHPRTPRKIAPRSERTSSNSESNMVSTGFSPLAVPDVSATRQHALHTHPSNSSVENPYTNYRILNTVQRQPTSITTHKQYNSPNTTTPPPNLNKNVTKPVVAITPNQEGSTKRRVVADPPTKLNENHPSKTNLTSLRTPPTSSSDPYNSTTAKARTSQQKKPVNIYSSSTGQLLKAVSVTKLMTSNNRPLPSSSVETPSSSNLQTSSQLINPTLNAQKYSSTIEYFPTPILSNMLRNTPDRITTNERQLSVNVVNKSSTNADSQERNVFASTSSTVKTPSFLNSRTDDINLSTLLKETHYSSARQYDSSSVSTPMSNNSLSNAQNEGANYGSQLQFRYINMYSTPEPENPPPEKTSSSRNLTNSVPGLEFSALSALQVGTATNNQAVQSSQIKPVYAPTLISSHLIPITTQPTMHPNPVIEPAMSVSRLSSMNNFANQQESIGSASASSTTVYPVLTSNLSSSSPREVEPSSNPTQPIPSDLTQPTAAPRQVSALYLTLANFFN